MRQGNGNNSNVGRKTEPRSMAINPGGVGQIGVAQGSHVTDHGDTGYRGDSVHAGRGYKAPGVNSQTSNCGSQGKH